MPQILSLQLEMNRMKEENTQLRKAVDRSMKDYYDLQRKFVAIQNQKQQQQQQQPKVSWLLISTCIHFNEGI